jgi:hypothetical protein
MMIGMMIDTEPDQELKEDRLTDRVRRALLGAPRDVADTSHLHKMSLIAFLAWVGLGADGLSSSAYGPEEAFRALGQHTYLAVALAFATALTVLIISASYSSIIEQFPTGGGGYVVASHLLGPRTGVVSGCARVRGETAPPNRHFMAEDHGELVLVLHPRQEAGVDVERAARIGERVERRILDYMDCVVDGRIAGHPARLRDTPGLVPASSDVKCFSSRCHV